MNMSHASVVTRYQYDEAGNKMAQVDALLRTNTFAYDGLGRRISHTMPGNQVEGFCYDLGGNLLYQTNFNGVIITNRYDAVNRLTNKAPIFGYNVSFAYSLTGRRTNLIDPSGTTVYLYDNRDRLMSKTNLWNNGPAISLNYKYDANGNVTNIASSTANGVNLAYSYDPLSRLTNVLANGNAAAGYGYDLVGNLQAMRCGNGVTNLYQYDSLNRLTNSVWKTNGVLVANFFYQLGRTGNRTNVVESVNGARQTNVWSYDPLYRLTNEIILTGTSNTLSYAFDPVGNRTNRNSTIGLLPGGSGSFTTNDWLVGDIYDKNGNTRTNGSSQPYFYDVENRLTNFNNGAVIIGYNGDGIRVSKTNSSTHVTTYYLVDDRNPSGYAQVLEEWTDTGSGASLSKVYAHGLNLISQRVSGVGTNFFGYDGHGSTRFLTGPTGCISNVFAYDAFGTLIASNTAPQTVYLYCGEQFDPDLGFYYLRARYLNPNTGRFWTIDTFQGDNEYPQTLHKYLYGADDPVNMVDPSGNKASFSPAEAAAIGREVHNRIGQQFVAGYTSLQRVTAQSVFTVFGLKNPQSGKTINGISRLFPDLVDIEHHEIYEIKPLNLKGIAGGVVQLSLYLAALNELDPSGRSWGLPIAAEHFNSTSAFFTTSPFAAVVVAPPVLGMIFYEAETPQDFVKARAKNVAEEEAADIEDSVDIGTLDSAMGAP